MKAPTTGTAQLPRPGVQSVESNENETNEPPNTRADIPAEITCVSDGLTAFGRVMLRGEVIEITPELERLSRGRDGNSFLTCDDDAQIRRWSKVMFRPGNFSAEIAAADEVVRIAGIHAEKVKADADGLASLKIAWAEERAATERAGLRWKSTNSRPFG